MNPEKAKQISRALKAMLEKKGQFHLNELRVIIALERAIARLSQDKVLAEHLIFKGGFVLLKSFESPRFTRDADALARAIPKEKLKDLVRSALEFDLEDGLWFGDFQLQELDDQGEYGAYRFDCAFLIGKPDLKKVRNFSRIHLDIAFNDKLPLKIENQIMSSVLEYEEPVSWKVYPIEYIVAEKIQTLFDRGSANSRSKDIYDLIYLLPRCSSRAALTEAIKNTFENRKTQIPESFLDQARKLDTTILSHGWPGIHILKEKPSFIEAWNMLLDSFSKI